MSGYTPGPWFVPEHAPFQVVPVDAPLGIKVIAECHEDRHTGRDAKEMQANARLIAAAPELLEAAKYMRDIQVKADRWGDQIPEEAWRDAEEQLEAAIKKAEGREA